MISFLASVIGAICGIGGGGIIKPTLDLFQLAGVSTISFLSGCTVLTMSCYSVVKGLTWWGLSSVLFGGVCGGIVGRMANKKLDNQAADKLFIGIMVVIIAISLYNSVQYLL